MPTVAEVAKSLHCSEAEAQEVLRADKAIDNGEKLFELSAEQKKVAKKYRNTTGHTYTFKKKERKVDNPKRELIRLLCNALQGQSENLTVENAEREFTFTFQNRKFKVTLSAPRS